MSKNNRTSEKSFSENSSKNSIEASRNFSELVFPDPWIST
jgi:hypothetical protein